MEKQTNEKDRRMRRRKATLKKRRRTTVIISIVAIAMLAASVPGSALIFDRVLESNADVNVISNLLAKVIPDSLIQMVMSKMSSSSENADSGSALKADELANADVTDPNVLAETTPVSDTYFDQTLIFGDASYNILKDEELFPANNLFTISNFTPDALSVAVFTDPTTSVSATIDQIVAARNPAQIYLVPGTTGIDSKQSEAYIASLLTLVQKIKESAPDTKIVLVSVSPTGSSASVPNDQIRTFNGELLTFARGNAVFYLNTFPSLCNERGVLSEDYSADDGQLNKDGAVKWLDILKKHAVPTS